MFDYDTSISLFMVEMLPRILPLLTARDIINLFLALPTNLKNAIRSYEPLHRHMIRSMDQQFNMFACNFHWKKYPEPFSDAKFEDFSRATMELEHAMTTYVTKGLSGVAAERSRVAGRSCLTVGSDARANGRSATLGGTLGSAGHWPRSISA